jgi:hypothetical protein
MARTQSVPVSGGHALAEATADPWLIERVTFETMADALVCGARDMAAAAVNRARHGHEYR